MNSATSAFSAPTRSCLRFPIGFWIAAFLLIAFVNPAAARARERPNVVLIMTDDQGWFDLGVHGNPDIETPNMDRLAAEGVRFSRFYASPVCTPTRAALMTGRYYHRTGAFDTYMGRDTLGAGEITLGQLFQSQGYRTGAFGKWHLGRYMKYHPNNRGFDEYFGFWQYGFTNHYMDPDQLFHNREPVVDVGYITDVLTDQAIRFVKEHGRVARPDRSDAPAISASEASQAPSSRADKPPMPPPFFLYLPYNAPHGPFLVPDPYIEKYLAKGLPLREARIYGMITSLDENIGRLLETIDEEGLRENTVVIFMSDNGGVSRHYKAGLRGNKGSVYEGGIRVPLFVRWPAHFPAGKTFDVLAQHIDVFPTLAELIGAPLPSDRKIDGKSLLALLEGRGGPRPHDYLFHQWTRVRPDANHNWAVQDGRYKLANGELFDLQRDPGEQHDLASQHPEIVRRLRAVFEEWFADVTAGQTYERVPIEVGRDDENPVEIDLTWGEAVGEEVRPTYRHYNRDTIENWSRVEDYVRWKIDVVQAGRYEVELHYGCDSKDAGGRFRVAVGDSSLEGTVEASAGRYVIRPRTVGVLELAEGPDYFEMRPLTIPGRELMALHKIWLRRLPESEQASGRVSE